MIGIFRGCFLNNLFFFFTFLHYYLYFLGINLKRGNIWIHLVAFGVFMCRKTPAIAYYCKKIKSMNKKSLLKELEQAPIKKVDYQFMSDIIDGLTYKELALKYNKSEKRIYQWKHDLFIKLHQFDIQQLR